jgi:hypothetical protein
MSLPSASARLDAAVTTLGTRLSDLGQQVEDRPTSRDTVVADLVRDSCDDLRGWVRGLALAVQTARRAAELRRPDELVGALAHCAEAVDDVVQHYVTGLARHDALSTLGQLAADRPGAWANWAWDVQRAVTELWLDVGAARREVDHCWHELAEHLVTDPVVVQAHVLRTTTPLDAPAGGP